MNFNIFVLADVNYSLMSFQIQFLIAVDINVI